ncbi:unnamed protein product [Adineta steineri]|uniref:Uncharacterized protein n=1 Tax=Adineta steineri TaxID=433720 RepID=A0A814DGA6_9BILA|nr:unnamed protein product [Adineta steineri]CAF3770600.1 unnamed protein product [Adineta steineri]
MDLNSIALDLNPFPTIETQSSIRTETTDYSRILRRIAGINTSSIPCVVVCIAFDLIFTLITLVVGASNISACPIEHRIPIYLIVSSVVNLVSIFFTIVACILHRKEKDDNIIGFFCVISSAIIIIILQLFIFIWLILGTVWLFSIFNQVEYDPQLNSTNYCQSALYKYTMISIILQYIIPIVMCCCKNASIFQ